MKTKVINFFGGPSAGKSTTAASLFAWMKQRRILCEYAPEYAKDVVWGETTKTLDDQLYVFGKQHHRLYRLLNKVEYIITDSPLLLSLYYSQTGMRKFSANNSFNHWYSMFEQIVRATCFQYDNINFFVVRGDRGYIPHGRLQTEDEAKAIDNHLRIILYRNASNYYDIQTLDQVLEVLGLNDSSGENKTNTSDVCQSSSSDK